MLDYTLFHFLRSVSEGRPQAFMPLLPDNRELQALYADPHRDLRQAVRHCLDALLREFDRTPARWGALQIPAELFGPAIAANNCLAPRLQVRAPEEEADEPADDERPDPIAEYTSALLATIPPARDRDTALAYHAVLRNIADSGEEPPSLREGTVEQLIERSPLTALTAFDKFLPAALSPLAAELLMGWGHNAAPAETLRQSPDEWLALVSELLNDEHIARWARHQWLALPETRPACRNLGLLLEALRRRGEHRELILEFYELYDRFRACPQIDSWGRPMRVWPVLAEIEKLLRVPGEHEAAIRLNRRGNEYFLKFRPLIELIIAENGLPRDYRLLSRELVSAVRPLLRYVTERAPARITFEDAAKDFRSAN